MLPARRAFTLTRSLFSRQPLFQTQPSWPRTVAILRPRSRSALFHTFQPLRAGMKLSPSDHPAGHLCISPSAVEKLKAILKKDENADAALRVLVDSGGCHGYQYRLELTHKIDPEEDIVLSADGARVVVDTISLPLMTGSTVDYTEELIGSTFKVTNNPLAANTCGCDVSFEIK